MPDQFFQSNGPGNLTLVCRKLEIVHVSGWQLVIAVSLKIYGGVIFIMQAKLHMA